MSAIIKVDYTADVRWNDRYSMQPFIDSIKTMDQIHIVRQQTFPDNRTSW